MTEEITISFADLWWFLLALAGGISTISAAFAVIVNIVHKAKEPNKRQDEELAKLKEEVKEIKERLEIGDRRFESDAKRMYDLEKSMKDTNKIIIESLQALTAHAIDGNNIDQLRNAEKSLNDYLIDKL